MQNDSLLKEIQKVFAKSVKMCNGYTKATHIQEEL